MERALIAAGSVSVFEGPEEDAPLVTELIVGERLGVLEERDGWLRVVVPGYATGLDSRGYPGWARLDGLVEAPGWDPDLTAVAPNSAGLPLGALLRRDGGDVRLPEGGVVALEPGSVMPSDARPAVPVGRHRLHHRNGLFWAGLPRDGAARRDRTPRRRRPVRSGAVQ